MTSALGPRKPGPVLGYAAKVTHKERGARPTLTAVCRLLDGYR
jgi:hypothetical protein